MNDRPGRQQGQESESREYFPRWRADASAAREHDEAGATDDGEQTRLCICCRLTHIQTHAHLHTHTCTRTHILAHMHTHTCTCTHTYTCARTHTHTHVHLRTHAHTTAVPQDHVNTREQQSKPAQKKQRTLTVGWLRSLNGCRHHITPAHFA